MNLGQPYNQGVAEIFSNFAGDPCLSKACRSVCPVGFTCMRARPPRSGELRLDLSGCNLACPFCWTIDRPSWRTPTEICDHITCRLEQYHKSDVDMGIVYMRVTGGEPILNRRRMSHLMEIVRILDDRVAKVSSYSQWKQRRSPSNVWGRRNIKIQTNGTKLPDVLDSMVALLREVQNICLTFEVSLKGTNAEEFSVLSGRETGFKDQISALERLIECEKQGYPIFARAIVGILHSEQYDLVSPSNGQKMMLNPSGDFRRIVEELATMPLPQQRVYVEPLRFTDQMKDAELRCRSLGILAPSEIGKCISPGKKLALSRTYLRELVRT